ncbi:hypothetical protein TNIN_102431, partial [Trichonephila inaurata madagascariensis]
GRWISIQYKARPPPPPAVITVQADSQVMRRTILRIKSLRICISHMGQKVKDVAKIGKFMKTNTLTEEFYSTKCLHACIELCANMVVQST